MPAHTHAHTHWCCVSSKANWKTCQTASEPIRALHAQPMAAADTEKPEPIGSPTHPSEVDIKKTVNKKQ